MTKTVVFTEHAPKPPAQYSHAARKGNVLALAGQVGIDPSTGKAAGDDVGTQARQAFLNLQAILDEVGASFDDIIMIRMYLADPSYYDSMNEVYNEFVPEPYPARTTIFCGLYSGLLVEVDALAVVE